MKKLSFFLITACLALFSCISSAKNLNFYFDDNIRFDPSIPTPESVLGYQVGDWHVRHDQLVSYMKLLAEKSERINIEVIGYSHEQRPLLLLTIANPARLNNIETVRKQHLAQSIEGATINADAPVITWMGYSVHGNEASGSNAALLVAYYLAAAQGEKIDRLLDETVILLDPALNPDGLARFAQWVNSHKGKNLVADENHREHNEAWPSGRTNHYFTDLNRDWLLLQHPESQARIAKYHQWMPHVLTDFHEMGPHSTYFFQPGIPSRKFPLTPEQNVELTKEIATFHAAALDQQGELYFTEESFDDFYIGKGSTYPDIHGTIGILFEQGSARGHKHETINGVREFYDAVKNQLTTSLSTFDAVVSGKQGLLSYQQKFYQDTAKLVKKDKVKGYVVAAGNDKSRYELFLSLLQQHQIKAYPLSKDVSVNKQDFSANSSVYIPLNQPQYRLIKGAFLEQTSFNDNTFYDVSGWNLAHSFNLEFSAVTSTRSIKYQDTWQSANQTENQNLASSYAFAFEWNDYLAPKLLSQLQQNGVIARAAMKPFTASTANGEQRFAAGAIIIAKGLQQDADWFNKVQQLASNSPVKVHQISSGLTAQGVDIGSRNIVPLKTPKVLLLGGKGTSQYEVGEVWYYLDRYLDIAATLVDLDRLERIDLASYTHVILTNGSFSTVNAKMVEKLKYWVQHGGVIWGHKSGAKFLADKGILKAEYLSSNDMAKAFPTDNLSYADKDSYHGDKRIAGAIFNADIDLSHPLSFSFERNTLPVFKNSTFVLKPSEKPFVNVATYTKTPLLAGFSHELNNQQIAGAGVLMAHNYGKGKVIAMSDNPVFRSYWYGTSRLLSNAIFFGHAIDSK
ncbi:M14 metallopeptidase family protein [Pseudoalteromonas spongiae]|uniref:M14 metallopeptidase family protein n=1 Tax=Pseudoalteromonas spongiae TaxID=298657 RepID=UPI0037355260